jgi:uncharacterized protein YjiS (DUF1127 family)
MMTLFTSIRDALSKHAAYVRTRNEIREMPLHMALDLDIYRGDADLIARQAVYG